MNVVVVVSGYVTYSFLTGHTFTSSYSYDAASNRTGFTSPDSSTNTYSYDTLNRLSSLANSWAGTFGFSYDALSRRTQMTRPNSITTNYTYDTLSRLLSVLHQSGGSTIDGATYTLDAAGNRTSKEDWLASVTSNYTYDAIYQVTQVTQGTSTTESYSYDSVGNRTVSLGVASYTTNASNELTATSNASYTFDANGNTTSKTASSNTTSYSWDYENRLTSVTLPGSGGTVSFKYDPFGRRIYKSSSSTTSIYAYDGDNLVEETNSSGTEVASYSQGLNIDEPLAMDRSSAASFYEADGLGSVTSLSSGAGALVQTYTVDTFGKQIGSTGSVTNPFQYTARELDSETGLIYYRARYYDPTLGRFANEDPLGLAADENSYRYVHNDPIGFGDAFGLYTIQQHINKVEKPSVGGLDEACYPEKPAGSCTKMNAFLTCPCHGCGDSWKISADASIVGNMYVFSGPWRLLGRTPIDTSVKDMPSAIDHENNVHIKPGIEALKPFLSDLESKTFSTEKECNKACKKAEKALANLFRDTEEKTKTKDRPQ